jgi:hypothetical protein
VTILLDSSEEHKYIGYIIFINFKEKICNITSYFISSFGFLLKLRYKICIKNSSSRRCIFLKKKEMQYPIVVAGDAF